MATALERGFARGQTMTHNASPDSLTMPVEQRDIGCIIGRGGSKIRQLEQDSGARIKVCIIDIFCCNRSFLGYERVLLICNTFYNWQHALCAVTFRVDCVTLEKFFYCLNICLA